MRAALLLLALTPLPAFAACQPDAALFHCQIGKRTLQICEAAGRLTYDFGPTGKPELSLSVDIAQADFTPWPGIGRTMWDELAFHNEGVTYRVWTALEKQMEENQPEPVLEGGVTVMRGDEDLASLTCDEGTVTSLLDIVSNMKAEIGQCWDYATLTWRQCD
jgi:hypothetical protein